MLYFLLSMVVFLHHNFRIEFFKAIFLWVLFCPSTEGALGRKDTVGGQDSMALIEEVSPGRNYTHGELQIFFRNPDRPGGLNLIEKKKFQARCSVQIFFMHF